MASLDRVLELKFKGEDQEELLTDEYDWKLPKAFSHKRHNEKIEGTETSPQTWRMKERMKTVSVALVICLNVGVDPPGISKTQPCARLECWIDPLSLSPQKALETIGNTLQKQYERWQPRARYKTSLDPTVDEVKKLCSSLRRNAKDERVLFHYNGHGVPQPTNNGEIWVFNRNYTQYIPLSIYDLQTWMGSPSIYVYDCSNAGLIIKSFHQFAEQHEREYEEMLAKSAALSGCPPPNFSGCIQLGACGESQLLPMNPDLPADLFTACLTTPMRIALKWFLLQNKDKLIPKVTLEMMEKVPGQLNDRRTMLGELNWIFTAITDTIAWNILPRHLFQKLFRQDLLVASLFRNYLLAERIMRSYDCTPTSSPKLPPTSQHPMWAAWDLVLDLCLTQLPGVLEDIQATHGQNGANRIPNGNSNINTETLVTNHLPSPFFEEQLTAFQVWLEYGSENRQPPEQLPIVLQVLLSQIHRVRALELLGRFLDLGWWAVNLALAVGIFPYVLKLLQSSARELRPLLVFIWAKILAVDHSCQADLVRDGSHKYFITIVGDTSLPFEHRTMAVFVLTNIVRDHRLGQQAALQSNLVSTCLLALDENDKELKRWVCICLGLTWADFSSARWCGVRDSAHEKIYSLLDEPDPEVRAAAVFALGTFINTTSDRTEHANAIDRSVAMTLVTKLCGDEASPLVRQEIVVALHNFMLVFENNFVAFEQQNIINNELQSTPAGGGGMRRISSQTRMKILSHANPAATVTGAESHASAFDPMRRVASSSSLSSLSLMGVFSPAGSAGGKLALSMGGIYGKVYTTMLNFEKDPYPGVALLAKTVMDYIRQRAREILSTNGLVKVSSGSGSSANTTPVRGHNSLSTTSSGSSPGTGTIAGSPTTEPADGTGDSPRSGKEICPLIGTKYIEWCWDLFARPTVPGQSNGLGFNFCHPPSHVTDTQDDRHHTQEWRYNRNTTIRKECFRRLKAFHGKLDEQVFSSRTLQHSHGSTPTSTLSSPSFSFTVSSHAPSIVRLHEYEKLLLASEGPTFSIYEIGETQRLVGKWENSNDSRITTIDWVNTHDESLVMVGGDDGSLRIWKPDVDRGKPKLLTSWNPLAEIGQMTKSSKSFGLLAKWDTEREKLLATGDTKIVRVWDLNTELKIGDWPTGLEGLVTSIDIHRCEPNLACLGLDEGVVRLIDIRLPQAECGVVTWRDFDESWIVGATLRYDRTVVAGSANGKIRFFDLRSRSPTKTIDTSIDITALTIHQHLPYFASGCLKHSVNVYGFLGQSAFMANEIRDGHFISGRMGAVTSLHFHPYKPLLATADSYSINVHKNKAWGV